jgi:Rps23 Pro-64 3,4-dihydroxylase Tpa1-like proline 4-hydroxylase
MLQTSLQRWIQPQHLDARRLAEYARTLAAHPARLLVLQNVLVDEAARALSRFLSAEAVYERRYGLYSKHEQPATEEEFLAAAEADRFYRYGRLAGPRDPAAPSQNLLTFLRFRAAWSDEPFAEFFRQATGLALEAGALHNAHAYGPGDFLLSHRDDHDRRRLAVVLYLSRDWTPEDGGALELVDRHGQKTRVPPDFNSLVLFDVHAKTLHQIQPVTGTKMRLTLGGWLDGPSSIGDRQ